MAEYPPRQCGPCPKLGKYDKANEPEDYLQKNTVPKPEVVYLDHNELDDHHLGIAQTHHPPDLSVSPTQHQPSSKSNLQELPQQGSKNPGHGNCAPCCDQKINQQAEEPCPISPYALEQCAGSKSEGKPLKGILKNTKSAEMAAIAGRTAPGQIHPSAQPPVPNELRPVPKGGGGPCYLPQPEDEMPDEKADHEMGPIGPWATGRVDWGPLSGMTGTRPVVDKYSITRYSEGEWRKHNYDMLNMASQAQHKANLVDWNGRRCLEQTRSDVDKNQEDSTKRLSQREQDVHRWKCELEMSIAAASEEIGFLEEQRRRLKHAMAVLMMPEAIASECLERRTGRLDPELVRDEVEEELIKELALTAEIREQFTRTLKDIELQLMEDKTAKQRLEYDWSDKTVAHQIESVNVALNLRSTTMLFKSGATMFPDDQSSSEHWEHFTRETLQEGEATRQRSVTLRGTLDAILTNASRDLRSQADRVDMALAKRIGCTDQVRMELENNLKKILQRLADVEDLVRDIRDAIRRMDLPMKKAQTRLDNRLLRPRVENCRDDAHFGLVEEVKSIGENVSALMAQLKQAEDSQANLIQARSDMEKEIMMKRKTLEIDRTRTQLIRSHYPSASALSGH